MSRRTLWILAALIALLRPAFPARADLDAYFKKPEPAYHWEKRGETQRDGGMVYDLHLVSQTWQGIVWEHRLQLFIPEKVDYPHFCTLLNTGGNGGEGETALGMTLAKSAGAPFAILYNIPKQPLYGGLTEDALVVYTWLKYLETGDESWPLHFPMAKSVLKAMDALQEFTKSPGQTPITEFLITGASKRGWTTWLAGASRDKRIKGIAPMVIDTLNLPAQGPHQLAAWGKFSEQIDDYVKLGIPQKLQTEQGKKLIALEDPYSYRDRLTLPKLLINGTNDRYWTQDSLNLYWDGLKGQKWVLYVPNSGHGLEDRLRVANTLSGFARALASNTPWPKMRWTYREVKGGVHLQIQSRPAPTSARLFRVFAPTQDFRESKWTSEPMEETRGGYAGHLDRPATGYAATFGEATYNIAGKTFTLSTQIHILGAEGAPPPAIAPSPVETTPKTPGLRLVEFQPPANGPALAAEAPDNNPPAVNPGRPTLTDPAALTAPGWLESEFGLSQNLDRDRTLGTPLLLKLTSKNRRLQYRLATDGYLRREDGTDGIGDTYFGLHYLFLPQDRAGYDVAGRITVKLPTQRGPLGGTKKVDYNALFLASRDFTKWGLHGDFNVGLSALSRQDAPGTDGQLFYAASLTAPFKGGRWAYTNELTYSSPIQGQRGQVTMMHGFTYAVHRYEVYDVALQWGLFGDGSVFQVLVGRTFFFGRLF